MPTYLHPGVYVEEVPSGARPIEAVGTSTAAFVGITEMGPLDKAELVTNFTEFQQRFGGYVSDPKIGASYLAYSVFQFFQNGGRTCYVVRVEDGAQEASVDLYTDKRDKTMTVSAVSPGLWGNDLRIAIGPPTTSKGFNMYVFLKDELVESYVDLSMINTGSFFVDKITKKSLYIRTKSFDLPDNPTFTGRKNLSAGIDLSKVNKIKLGIDKFGPYVIDCSEGAAAPGQVDISTIVSNINKAFNNDIKVPVASVVTEGASKKIRIDSPTSEQDSKIIFTAPQSKDATYDIFGLQESSWAVTGVEKTIAQAFGMVLPAVPAELKFAIALAGETDKDITIAAGDNVYEITKKINAGVGADAAFTDGMHIVLMSDRDIFIRRADPVKKTDAEKIFGGQNIFYSYVHKGSDGVSATIKGDTPIGGAVNGPLRLKIDSYQSILVNFTGEATADAVAGAINSAFQKVSKGKKKIAQTTSDNKIVLDSINTGPSGRIIVTSLPGGSAAQSVFGNAYQNADDFMFPAEKQSVAELHGNDWGAADKIGAALANRTLSISAESDPAEFLVTNDQNLTLEDLFGVFKSQTPLNHKLLAKVTSASISAHVVVASLTSVPEIRFSIPLVAAGAEEHVADAAASTHAAYKKLFGDISPFTGNPYTSPNYTHKFELPNNNPAETVIKSGEELDFSQSLSLSGGAQDRSSESKLANLTLGEAPTVVSGLSLLDTLTDVNILVVPGWSKMNDATALRFINGGIAYCDKLRPSQARPLCDLFFVTNTPSGVKKPEEARDFVKNQVNRSGGGGYAAIYYPWVDVTDPIGSSSPTISLPPAGLVAGLYASIDGKRGVWKAPAGTEAGLPTVISLDTQVNDIKQDLLNPHGVNAIRKMPGAGSVLWGARTLASIPEWKYIPVRRTAIMMEVSIYEGIQWAVFEPNDEPLWSRLRLNVNAFMMNLYRNGAFQGTTPDEAFFVKCDSETTTQVDIDLGRVIVLVGFAPLKPAEFVIVRISQKAGKKE